MALLEWFGERTCIDRLDCAGIKAMGGAAVQFLAQFTWAQYNLKTMSPADPFSDAMRAWSAIATGLPGAANPGLTPLDALLMQAHWVSSAALARSGQRGSQSWLDYGKVVATQPELPRRVDAARAHLRRLAEIAADEARQAEAQLRGLDEQLRALVEPAPTTGEVAPAEPVRYARAKP